MQLSLKGLLWRSFTLLRKIYGLPYVEFCVPSRCGPQTRLVIWAFQNLLYSQMCTFKDSYSFILQHCAQLFRLSQIPHPRPAAIGLHLLLTGLPTLPIQCGFLFKKNLVLSSKLLEIFILISSQLLNCQWTRRACRIYEEHCFLCLAIYHMFQWSRCRLFLRQKSWAWCPLSFLTLGILIYCWQSPSGSTMCRLSSEVLWSIDSSFFASNLIVRC